MRSRTLRRNRRGIDASAQRHAERSASGICTRCGRVPPEPGLKVCGGCAEKRRAAEKARRDRARSQGKLYRGRDPERCRRADRAGRQAAAEGTARRRTVHVMRPPAARRQPLRLRAMPQGQARTRPPALWRSPRRRLLRTLQAANRRRPVALRPVPRAGEGTRLPRAGERRQQETICRPPRQRHLCRLQDACR